MTDYSKLSDREIDRLVLNTIYGVHADDKDIQGCWSRGGFKYTSDASDAWPIIQSNNITIVNNPVSSDSFAVDDIYAYMHCSDGFTIAYDQNTLRAAMIVFLMTQENKQ